MKELYIVLIFINGNNHPTQPCTFAIRTSQHAAKNCKRACLFANAFLPTLKTNFFGNGNTSIELIEDCNELIRTDMNKAQHTTAGYSPCRKSRFYKKMNGKIKDVTL